jgi:hypothetical protein
MKRWDAADAVARAVVVTWAIVAAALLAAGVISVASISPKSNVQTIYIRNVSTYVADSAVKNALPAFNAAAHEDFAPSWHIDANLVFIGKAAAPVGASTITIVDKGPVKGALAYHELVNGVPDSIIYAGTSRYYGYSWSVALTHELWEQLADVPAGAGAVSTMQGSDGTIWAQEVADPVESDADAYTRPGADGRPVLISDFVTQKWFGALTSGPYDFANHIQQPLQIDKGGYAQWWDGVTWNIVENFRGARDRGYLLGDGSLS